MVDKYQDPTPIHILPQMNPFILVKKRNKNREAGYRENKCLCFRICQFGQIYYTGCAIKV